MQARPAETVLIGAGIHGVSVALALAARGRRSVLLEAGPEPLARASLLNEGKIHLGFVYALDKSGETARAMVEGALAFAPLIERWCGEIDWVSGRSEGFGYVVMDDGLSNADELEAHYETVLAEIARTGEELGTNYLGVDLDGARVTRRNAAMPGMREGLSTCWFETPEMAFDPREICRVLAGAVADEPLVEVLTGRRVTGVDRSQGGYTVLTESPAGEVSFMAEHVVNCAWEGRPALDAMVLGPGPQENFRVKHRVLVRGGESNLSPVTLVQGPFGDVVPWPNGDVYISWYPDARTHFGNRPAERAEADREVAGRVHRRIAGLFPAVGEHELAGFGPCYILARGSTDINDPGSGLHKRAEASFVEADGWWSIRSSKLTTAPLAGERCAAAITGSEVQV